MSHSNDTVESYISLQNNVAFALVITLVVMSIINTGIHSFAAYIFLIVRIRTSQIIDLINLSTIQVVVSCLVFLDEGAELIYDYLDIADDTADVLKKIDCYMYIIIYVLFCMYYIGMILLLLDRFLLVYLHLQYEIYWSPYKSKCTVIVIWVSSIIICVLMCIIHWQGVFNYRAVLTGVISPTFNAGLIIFAVAVYVYLFCKFRDKRNSPTSSLNKKKKVRNRKGGKLFSFIHICEKMNRKTDKNFIRSNRDEREVKVELRGKKPRRRKESVYRTFCNSRFYLDLLMVISFIVFLVIPNLVYLCHGWDGRKRTHEAKDANKVSYQLLFLINFVLCVIMHPDVRQFCQSTRRRRMGRKKRHFTETMEEIV